MLISTVCALTASVPATSQRRKRVNRVSYLDKLPVLEIDTTRTPITHCLECGYILDPSWRFCPECGEGAAEWEDNEAGDTSWLCSLHPKNELSQEISHTRGIEVVCLTCGAAWKSPRESRVGSEPDFFRTEILRRFQYQYFASMFGVKL